MILLFVKPLLNLEVNYRYLLGHYRHGTREVFFHTFFTASWTDSSYRVFVKIGISNYGNDDGDMQFYVQCLTHF